MAGLASAAMSVLTARTDQTGHFLRMLNRQRFHEQAAGVQYAISAKDHFPVGDRRKTHTEQVGEVIF